MRITFLRLMVTAIFAEEVARSDVGISDPCIYFIHIIIILSMYKLFKVFINYYFYYYACIKYEFGARNLILFYFFTEMQI
jgi:hypothetical protein